MPIPNPFIYGKPVPPIRFIGRRSETKTIFDRLINGESSAVVGEPHIGKSSVLKYISDDGIRSEWLGKSNEQYLFVDIDCQLMAADAKPAHFWGRVIDFIKQSTGDETLTQQCNLVIQNSFEAFTLESLFKLMGKKGWHAVLLIDEFDVLTNHPNFNRPEFLGTLRSLASRLDALVVITASRASISEMNRRTHDLNPFGSPFLNNSTEVRIRPLAPVEAQFLIQSTLKQVRKGTSFSPDDYAFLFSLAGRHPYLLQMAAASLFDADEPDISPEERRDRATRIFQDRVAAHFDDFWRHLVSNEQRALILLALAQYRGYTDGRSFDLHQIGQLEWYGPDLRHLLDMGVVESQAPSMPGSVSWLGENWRIAVGGIVPWLMDNIVSGTREDKSFGDWLHDKEYQRLLTGEETKSLAEIAGKIPTGAVDMAAGFIKSLVKK